MTGKKQRTVRGPHRPGLHWSLGLGVASPWIFRLTAGLRMGGMRSTLAGDAAGEGLGACAFGWGSIRLAKEEECAI